MTNVFSKFKNMNDQFSNALFIVMFLYFDTYAFESAQKAMSCMIPIYQSGVISQNVDFITSDDTSYQNTQHGFRTLKGNIFSL